jgi:DNA-binding response OmpR family regulator
VSTEEDAVAGAAAGVSSWLLRPFSSIYARTRLRAGVLRLR